MWSSHLFCHHGGGQSVCALSEVFLCQMVIDQFQQQQDGSPQKCVSSYVCLNASSYVCLCKFLSSADATTMFGNLKLQHILLYPHPHPHYCERTDIQRHINIQTYAHIALNTLKNIYARTHTYIYIYITPIQKQKHEVGDGDDDHDAHGDNEDGACWNKCVFGLTLVGSLLET